MSNYMRDKDYDLWLRISEFGKVLVIPNEMVIYYNYTTGKQVSAITNRYVDAIAYINKKYSKRINNLSPKEKLIKESSEYCLLANNAREITTRVFLVVILSKHYV